MRILHFIWSANFGGIEKLVIELTEQQHNASELEAELLIGCNKGQYLHLINEKQIKHHLANISSGWHFSLKMIKQLIKLMDKFDIIHIHTFNLPVMIAAVQSGKKIVYTIHGNFNYGKKIRITDRINNKLKSYFLNNKVSFITFNSNWSKKEAIKKYNLKLHQPNEIVYNGIKLTDSTNKRDLDLVDSQLNEKFIVGTIARLNKSKKIERLIDAFSIFNKDKEDVRLLIIGDGIEKKFLIDRVRSMALENKTVFTGYLENIKPHAAMLNLCVFPFQNEAFGLVVLEVFNMGKPVIIFNDSGGMQEILGDKFKNDIVDTVEELAERMQFYYNKKDKDDSLFSNERIQTAAQYSLHKMERNYYNCYNEII